MLVIAGIGLVANLIGVALLERGSHGSLNVRGAFWHILGDTISSVGVIIAGIIITITGWTVADPIAAIVIGVIILWGAVRLVRDSVDILMEGSPRISMSRRSWKIFARSPASRRYTISTSGLSLPELWRSALT